MSPTFSRRVRALAAAALTAGLLVAGTPAVAAAGDGAHRPDAVQKELDGLVAKDGFPAALAAVRDAKGRTRHYTAGVGDLKTKAKVPVDGRVRVASNTKMFTAVVVLQLVGEGKVGLDEPIETYLPRVVRGKGIDGREITVRQLLQHTSGLPNYGRWLPSIFETRDVHRSPQDLLDIAFAHEASFAPGTSWEYSNTNYVLAGLLVEKVTGRPLSDELNDRIIKPIGLRHTYSPAKGETTIRGRHPRAYGSVKPGGPLVDITDQDPSRAWGGGHLIATPSDLNRFTGALMGGRLLKPEQLAQMKRTVRPAGAPAGWEYGLGLMKMPLSCGGVAWGHTGDIVGHETRNGVTEDGRAATVAVTAQSATDAATQHVNDAMDTALCR
ncbi:serine hydrolase domain-containing protein [Nonomuraea purpurea]|uniref:Serine hydrolase domain-containing protein n=1 Tax=Nonomuraea purpurea TaxID=1849276 RepID=A0ABV8G771_9ACTN